VFEGACSKPECLRFSIEKVTGGPGIVIKEGCQAKVKGCTISECKVGIETVSAGETLLVMNKIHDNREDGVLTRTERTLRNDTIVRLNEIERNRGSGISCVGK